jgi:hypothetical protein
MIGRTLTVIAFIVSIAVGLPAIGYWLEMIEESNAVQRAEQ